jgi:putative nucleotidyltransferase with HDIG domain
MQYEDKTGKELQAQRFQMLQDIAAELSASEVIFPTYFDAALRIRNLLQAPNLSLHEIANAVTVEPLVSAKLLKMANSVAFNPSGQAILDLSTAIFRLGINHIRIAALSIATNQLIRAKGMAEFSDLTQLLWSHSIATAASARVIARHFTNLNPDEALLAGLIHDLGAFYMLYRSLQYDELRERPDSLKYVVVHWHESIGVSLLRSLGLPEEIVVATEDHDHPRPLPTPPKTLADIVYIANMLAGGHVDWSMLDSSECPVDRSEIEAAFAEFQDEIQAETAEMRSCFS